MSHKEIEELLELLSDLGIYYQQPCYYDSTPAQQQRDAADKLCRLQAVLENLLG